MEGLSFAGISVVRSGGLLCTLGSGSNCFIFTLSSGGNGGVVVLGLGIVFTCESGCWIILSKLSIACILSSLILMQFDG